jgi:hypothetical protein
MTPPLAELLLELSHRGVTVIPEGDRLRLRPRSALTADLLARIHVHRSEILALLAGHPLDALLRAGALPTRDEWRVLAALAGGTLLTHPQLLASTHLTKAALTEALCHLHCRREVIAYTSGHVRALVN